MLGKGGGGFWRPFQFAFDRWSLTVMVAAKLHNLCINQNVTVPIQRYHENVREGDRWSVFNNIHDDDDVLRGRAYGERRRHIASLLERNGIIRLYMPP